MKDPFEASFILNKTKSGGTKMALVKLIVEKYIIQFLLVVVVMNFVLSSQKVQACTAFMLKQDDKVLFCEGFDWYTGEGLVSINKKGIKKSSILAQILSEKPMTWISQYGSISFSWIGMSQPLTGMNSEGLAITSLIFNEKTAQNNDKPKMGISQWKEYVLDTCADVNEAVKSLSSLCIYTVSNFSTHYLIGDAKGNCAVIQFIDGQPIISTGKDLPYSVITDNLHYNNAVTRLSEKQTFPKGNGNQARFERVAQLIKNNSTKYKILNEQANAIFESVRIGGHTKWNIIFDLTERSVSFRTFKNEKRRFVNLDQLDLSCSTPIMLMDINKNLTGNISNKFVPYPNKINKIIINKSDEIIHFAPKTKFLLKKYPDNLVCVDSF